VSRVNNTRTKTARADPDLGLKELMIAAPGLGGTTRRMDSLG
jgi:hypothetical protein